MKKDYLTSIHELSNRIKTKTPKNPIQTVKPIKKKMSADNGHFNIWIPKELLKRIRTFAVQEEISVKEIGIQALNLYIATKTK